MNKYISLDNETGGLTFETSLLSTYVCALDENLNITAELELFTKPDDCIYRVEAQGMNVNKINLIEHDKIAKGYKECGTLLYNFLKDISDQGKNKLIPIGHNVAFDIQGLTNRIISKKSWDNFVGYRALDTGSVCRFLQDCGRVPIEVSAGLESMCKYFGITNKAAHTSRGDVIATIEVYKKLKEILK